MLCFFLIVLVAAAVAGDFIATLALGRRQVPLANWLGASMGAVCIAAPVYFGTVKAVAAGDLVAYVGLLAGSPGESQIPRCPFSGTIRRGGRSGEHYWRRYSWHY